MSQSPDPSPTATKSSPKRWTIGGVLVTILLSVYAVARPIVNQRFGLDLPPLVTADSTKEVANESPITKSPTTTTKSAQQEKKTPELPAKTTSTSSASNTKSSSKPKTPNDASNSKSANSTSKSANNSATDKSKSQPLDEDDTPSEKPSPKTSPTTPRLRVPPAEKPETKPSDKIESSDKTSPNTDGLLHGILKPLPRDEYVSLAGLRYTPGSEEGHRLKHLERHTSDQPNRPGRHGVFIGGMPGALKVIDEAYIKALKGGSGVQSEQEDGRTVYTVDLRRKIGYIGGIEGNRRNKPTAFRVRMVLDDDRVITAYPL